MEALVYAIKQALEVLPVSRATLYGLIGSGDIKTITIGRRRFITRAELERFVSAREHPDE